MKTIKMLAAALMITVCGTNLARASDKPASPADKPASTTLDDNGLKTMLENLGYETKPIKYSDNRTGYRIKITFKGYDAEMDVMLSPNGANIWSVVTVAELKSEHLVQTSRFVKILQLNQTYGPCHFRISKDGKYITLARGLANKSVTAKELKGQIDDLVSTAEQTAEHWDTSKWNAPAPAPMPGPGPMPVPEIK